MSPQQPALIPASALVASVLMPSWTPRRRLAGAGLIASACKASDAARGLERMPVTSAPALKHVESERLQSLHPGLGYTAKGAAMQAAVEVTRLLSTKHRLTGAALLGGAYLLAHRKSASNALALPALDAEAAPAPARADVPEPVAAPEAEPEAPAEPVAPLQSEPVPAPQARMVPLAETEQEPTTPSVTDEVPVVGPHGKGSAAPLPDGTAPAGFTIKGNENSMLFHMPGSRWYGVTVAEAWFDSPEAALAAGFQPAGGRKTQGLG